MAGIVFEGIVVSGKRLGRTIGFPTANLAPDFCEGDGPDGVYAAWFIADGVRRPCMLNIGRHPTVPDGPETIEANLLDFSGDLYGHRARIETVAYLRGETKFESVDALRQQLTRDRETTRRILAREQEKTTNGD